MEERVRLVLAGVFIIILLPIKLIVIIWGCFYPKKGMSIKDISTKEALPLIKEAEKDSELQHTVKTFFEKIENDKELLSSWGDVIACRNFAVSSVGLKNKWGESCLAPKFFFYCPTVQINYYGFCIERKLKVIITNLIVWKGTYLFALTA